MCVRPVCSWIFMNATREILTVYKEGAYRSIGVCIFNRLCTFPSFCTEKLMKLFLFEIFSNKYSCFFSATAIILDRQIYMECFQHTVSATNSLSYSVFEAKSLWQRFGHHLDNLHTLWRSAVKYLSTILLSYCAVRQNPLDWEKGGFCSPELKTERYNKEIKNRCLPHDAAYEEQLSQRRWIEAFLSSMMWRTPQSRWRGLLWRHYWVLCKDLPTRETITATRKQRWKRGLGWLTEDQTFWRTLSHRGQARTLHRVITCLIMVLHANTFF